jgi:hypothetical protein
MHQSKGNEMISHPIHILASSLEDKRLQLIEELARDTLMSADAMIELAAARTALAAVREATDERRQNGSDDDQELA